jgi:hypothetical protein
MGNVSPNGASGKPGGLPEYVALHWHRELCQCGHYFSHTRGNKMDTFEKNPNKELVNSRLVKAKTSKGGFRIRAFHCLFR